MEQYTDRAQKIKLLKDIEQGKRSVKELRPAYFIELKQYAHRPDEYIDHSGNSYTREEVNGLRKEKEGIHPIVMLEIKSYS